MTQTLGPVVGVVVGAWLQNRAGRKVRLKVDEIEVEARTIEEVERHLEGAKQMTSKAGSAEE